MNCMKGNRLFLMTLTMAVITLSLAAQAVSKTEVFDPFISGLRAKNGGKTVLLIWVDSKDVQGPVYVYRSIYPFNRSHSFAGITPVKVPYGVQFYQDEIDSIGIQKDTLYYFIAASDENGQPYVFPIVSKNTAAVQIPLISVQTAPHIPDTFAEADAKAAEEPGTESVLKKPRAFEGKYPDEAKEWTQALNATIND